MCSQTEDSRNTTMIPTLHPFQHILSEQWLRLLLRNGASSHQWIRLKPWVICDVSAFPLYPTSGHWKVIKIHPEFRFLPLPPPPPPIPSGGTTASCSDYNGKLLPLLPAPILNPFPSSTLYWVTTGNHAWCHAQVSLAQNYVYSHWNPESSPRPRASYVIIWSGPCLLSDDLCYQHKPSYHSSNCLKYFCSFCLLSGTTVCSPKRPSLPAQMVISPVFPVIIPSAPS